ncbi:O-Antigen Polymerase family [Clostridium botulinum C str. Eklund]|nr:O-Antigen Polymerase family [Clostridium botulinum C str. Eklund]NEZ48100.1 O-antigen ligase family protein [Clostridium botulinum]
MVQNKNKKNQRMLNILFALTIVMIPFNSLPYMKNIFGELSGEGAFYPLLIISSIVAIRMLYNGKIRIRKNKVFTVLFILFIWIIISGMMNMEFISKNYTKGRSGISKYVMQLLVYVFGMITTYISYYVVKNSNISLEKIRRYVIISFYIVGFYSIFEIMRFLNINIGTILISKIDCIIRNTTSGYVFGEYDRLRSVCAEASWFSMYAAFVFPWIFTCLFDKKNKIKYVFICGYFIVMILFTKSRSGYVIIASELLIMSIFILKSRSKKINKSIIVGVILFGSILLVPIINYANTKNGINIVRVVQSLRDRDNLSNIARYGCQKSSLNMGFHNPIFGVGLGQYGFYMPKYIDRECYDKSWEIRQWVNPQENTPWPPVHSLYFRIIGELGIIGFIIWIYLCGYILNSLYRIYKNNNEPLLLALFVSYLGTLLSFLNIDSFRFLPIWIIAGLYIKVADDY